ncbi:hypothetical protein H0H92_009799 [Tricholoma furcatifolium]|nr:hypothetical protein H0H92_009799 [Tricholoma furcatifolium]
MDHEHQSLLAPTPEVLGQLTASDINFSIVRPIAHKYARLKNMAVVYACLVVRSHFLAECENDLANAGVMQTRAALCEILAMKLLTRFASNHITLVAVLTTRWNPLAGAPVEVVDQVRLAVGGDSRELDSIHSALEVWLDVCVCFMVCLK